MDNGYGSARVRRGPLRRVATIFGILLAVAFVWIAVTVALLWHRQERVVFQPPAFVPDAPGSATRVDFRAADGHELYGYLVHPTPHAARREPDAVVIAFHGNADLSAWLVPWAQELARRTEALVFLPEYRGYGGIEGSPTYGTAANDARGAVSWARTAFPGARIVLFGHSLGSAIAAEAAHAMRDQPPSALVLQSPFTSARAMAARMLVPPIPALWGAISRVHYDTEKLVASLEVPVFVAHGTRDVVIPVRMGRAVFEAARRKGELLVVPGAGHNDVAEAGAEYWRWLGAAVSGVPVRGQP